MQPQIPEDMNLDDLISIVGRLVRRGIVTDVNKKKRKARVKFDDEDLPSGELRILANPPFIPKVDGSQRTEFESGGSGDEAFASHKHFRLEIDITDDEKNSEKRAGGRVYSRL